MGHERSASTRNHWFYHLPPSFPLSSGQIQIQFNMQMHCMEFAIYYLLHLRMTFEIFSLTQLLILSGLKKIVRNVCKAIEILFTVQQS